MIAGIVLAAATGQIVDNPGAICVGVTTRESDAACDPLGHEVLWAGIPCGQAWLTACIAAQS